MYVLMAVPSDFPNGDAGSVRDMAFASIFEELGYQVFLIGAGKNKKTGKINKIQFFSVYQEARSSFDHLRRFLHGKAAYMTLTKKIIEENGLPSVIYVNHISHGALEKLRIIAKKNNIPIVHDSTEWYSPCEFVHGKWDKQYILKDRLNRKIIRNPIKVIGISRYLTEYFQSRGLQAVRIPVIMDVINSNISVSTGEIVKLIYAGSPANKDYLKEMVIGTTLLSENERERLEFHILGASDQQIKSLTGLQALPACIKVYGRVPREKVEEVMLQMDFSVLLRPSGERYTKAGFPTKSVEAMSHGVAMICNISSDLGMYLKDGKNAIVVDGYNEKSFAESLKRVLSMNRTEIDAIKYNARQLAEKDFDYRNWIITVSNLIGDR